jgi:hypothetical protein
MLSPPTGPHLPPAPPRTAAPPPQPAPAPPAAPPPAARRQPCPPHAQQRCAPAAAMDEAGGGVRSDTCWGALPAAAVHWCQGRRWCGKAAAGSGGRALQRAGRQAHRGVGCGGNQDQVSRAQLREGAAGQHTRAPSAGAAPRAQAACAQPSLRTPCAAPAPRPPFPFPPAPHLHRPQHCVGGGGGVGHQHQVRWVGAHQLRGGASTAGRMGSRQP